MTFEQAIEWAVKDKSCPLNLSQAEVEPLNHGMINKSARLIIDGHCYLLKVFANQDIIPLNRQAQFTLQGRIARHQMAARPVYLSQCQTVWIEQWLELELFRSDVPDAIEQLAIASANIHQLPIQTRDLPLLAHWRKYQSHCRHPEQYEAEIRAAAGIWEGLEKNVLGHHDLALGHIAKAPKGMVIDWEYAANSSRFFDLCCTIRANQLSSEDQVRFISNYARLSGQNETELGDQVDKIMPLALLTERMWLDANRVCT